MYAQSRLVRTKCFSELILTKSVGLRTIFNSYIYYIIYVEYKKSNVDPRETFLCSTHLS